MLNKPYQRAFVPTMGALHAGHASLIQHAAAQAVEVVVSVFVNPLQFGANEDYHRYPRTLEQDTALATAHGATCVMTPTVEQMYGQDFASAIDVGDIGTILEGKARPGHFNGVATVVLKLLNRVQPNVLLLGEKDFQQLCVVRQMVRDFDMPVIVEGVPTVREPSGLALSSRNQYLSANARTQIAPVLYQALCAVRDGNMTANAAITHLLAAGFSRVDYLTQWQNRWLAAAYLENVRLIDNVEVLHVT